MSNAPKDAPTTREHRLHAILDVYSVLEEELGPYTRHWIDTGWPEGTSFGAPARVAQRRANAERNIRAAIVERLRALKARDELWSLELRLFLDELEAANRG